MTENQPQLKTIKVVYSAFAGNVSWHSDTYHWVSKYYFTDSGKHYIIVNSTGQHIYTSDNIVRIDIEDSKP